MPRFFAAFVLAAVIAGCSGGVGDSPGSRISVYSTAYLTEDNQVVYAVNSGPRPKPTPPPK
ncbi:MAG: hypothetical protein ACKOAS_02655, partial [Verrucomicrobiota bacterium]